MKSIEIRVRLLRFSLIVLFSCSIFVFSTIKYAEYIAREKSIVIVQNAKEQVNSFKIELKKYKEEYDNVVKIRDNYRASIKEIVDLLYSKDSHLGMGTMEFNEVKSSDEVTLLTIRNTVATMKDDQRMLAEVKNYLEARKEFVESFPFIWPVAVQGALDISSGFGFRTNVFDKNKIEFHEGIDIVGNLNDPIVATADGKIKEAGWGNLSGWYVVISHKNGFETHYGHMNKITAKVGQKVKRGDIIGYMGETGKTTGVHLHYAIVHNHISVDPMNFLALNY